MRIPQCPVIYEGPNYPKAHGTRCQLAARHERLKPDEVPGRPHKHEGMFNGRPLRWFTEEQKQLRHAE